MYSQSIGPSSISNDSPIQAPPKSIVMTEVISLSSDSNPSPHGQIFMAVGAPKQVGVQRPEGSLALHQHIEVPMIMVDRSEIVSPQDYQPPRENDAAAATGFVLAECKRSFLQFNH